MRFFPLALVLFAASCTGAPLPAPLPLPPPQAAAQPPPPALRLPETAAPLRYAVTLTLVPANAAFEGEVDIDLTFAEPSTSLWLNATALIFSEAHLEVAGRSLRARVIPGGEDFVGFAFDELVPAGPARLHAVYRGEISDKDDRGIFQEEEEGSSYLFSQFESIEARRAFPCFDEPSYKVPWQLTLRVPEADVALSNTRALAEEPRGSGMKAVRFAETKPLPSYLVAFAVGPFEAVDAGRGLRIVTPRGRASEAAYAVKVTSELLGRLEDYVGIPQPYDKLDIVAVPRLVSFGAMENPGLITCSAPSMLAKPGEETYAFERSYAALITHEMAHLWFGDLVTMAWWDDIWLNESFATWLEEKILGPARPEWRWELARLSETAWAMTGDGLVSARRVRQPIASKDDIQNAFDEISYAKGAAVLGMFESHVGPERMRAALRRYLQRHAHGTAITRDLLAAVSAETSPEVGAAMSTFLEQPGVPVLHAELRCEQSGEASLALRQRRYLPAGSTGTADQTWQIPVCVRWAASEDQGRACTLMKERAATLPLAGARRCPDWVLLDAGATGYYRSGYSGAALDALLRAGGERLTLAERLSVVRDTSALVVSGDLPMGEAQGLIPVLLKDRSAHMLRASLELARLIRDPFVAPAERPRYARFLQKTFGARARELGWSPRRGEDRTLELLRPELVPFVAVRGEDASLLAEARRLALRWLDDPEAWPGEVGEMVLATAASHGDKALYERFRTAAKEATDDRRLHRAVRAMASFREPALVRASVELFLSGALDPRVAVALVWSPDPRAQEVVFQALKERFDEFVARLPNELRGLLPMLGDHFCDEARRDEVEAFFKDQVAKLTGGPRNLAKTLEQIALCSAQRKAQEASVAAFLRRY